MQPYRELLAVMAEIGKLEDASKPLPRQLVEQVQQTLFQLRWEWSQHRYRAGRFRGREQYGSSSSRELPDPAGIVKRAEQIIAEFPWEQQLSPYHEHQNQRHAGVDRPRDEPPTTPQSQSPVQAPTATPARADWAGPLGTIGAYIRSESDKTLAAYERQPNLVREHANHEEDTARGGYAHRQLFELAQNSADALSLAGGGRIVIRLTTSHLYCADDGSPIDDYGVRALMFSHLSSKRGTSEIGRFGLGFKSVLGVTDAPEFFGRSGSFRFDRTRASEIIQAIIPEAERYPVLRLPEAIDPRPEMESDPVLRQLMDWAGNIVRLPLKPGAHADLAEQISNFPPRFLLFVPHVHHLTLQTGGPEDTTKEADDSWDNWDLELQTGEREKGKDDTRIFELSHQDGMYLLDDGQRKTRWMIFKRTHKLSPDARSDSRALDDADEVPLTWAAPLDGLSRPGRFWAFFPTLTASLLAGILNAPWKTNEDRQNLLPGVYNDELIDAAAAMVAENLPRLSTPEDPARHLDALPRGREGGDNEHSDRLRERLFAELAGRAVVPNQDGKLRKVRGVSYPPRELTPSQQIDLAPLERWAAYDKRPSGWLHHSAITTRRLATLDRLFNPHASPFQSSVPWATIAKWLQALLVKDVSEHDAVQSSMAAIQTAARIPSAVREGERQQRHGNNMFGSGLGAIVLTASGGWRAPGPESVYLSGGVTSDDNCLVFPELEADPETLDALRELGVRPASPESVFREYASRLLGQSSSPGFVSKGIERTWLQRGDERDDAYAAFCIYRDSGYSRTKDGAYREWRKRLGQPQQGQHSRPRGLEASSSYKRWAYTYDWDVRCALYDRQLDAAWRKFWMLARHVKLSAAVNIIQDHEDWRIHLRVRTLTGNWQPLSHTLLPGPIVPADGSRDADIGLDMGFHQAERVMLEGLDAVTAPLTMDGESLDIYSDFLAECREEYYRRLPQGQNPQQPYLSFDPVKTSGPLKVLELLSEEGTARYTEALLNLPATYNDWTMRHDTQTKYPKEPFPSPVVAALRGHGRIRTDDGIQELAAGLGPRPNPLVLRWLLDHPQAKLICQAFDIQAPSDNAIEPTGEDDSLPLLDVWPGLKPLLSPQQQALKLIRCDRIAGSDGVALGTDCIVRDGTVYLERRDDEVKELTAVLRELRLGGSVAAILRYQTRSKIAKARAYVRRQPTDTARLLAAVGETTLRARLPESLLAILDAAPEPLTDRQVADAAIATYHTGALREYRHALDRLDPPKQWAGGLRAVEFVQSLGFGADWAGERNQRRDPFVEVEGPYSLPPLHNYQYTVVQKLRHMLRPNGVGNARRGMISMPTGSGKTRVAVQAIVEAMRDDDYNGGVLWVADRDELCEQAVESWRQVWSSIGVEAAPLRISRMWAGQPQPLPTNDRHVIVATVQTLNAKIMTKPYEFLADFGLIVFDEAHRSVAPTYTSVMQELGLTRWQRSAEPRLLGLTATPYRGHDEAETRWLVRRYSSNRLDVGAFASDDPEDVIRELQDMEVLAQADHDTIEGGRISLDPDELRQVRQAPWLPQSAEERIARDPGRTTRIIEAYKEHILSVDPKWPTLIFATSVEHAQTVSALLNRIGVKARAVSGATDPSSRRSIVEAFRAGEIQALVNYAVFREGFDAPKTRAIIVARPVYSPNLYFQMIGRGLRGEKNGGNDRCLILNVEDNIENFEGKLAFSDLDWLWA